MTPSEEVFEAVKLWAETLLAQGYNPADIKAGIKGWLINEDVELPAEKPKDRRRYSTKETYAAWKRQRGICPECGGILIDPHFNSQVEQDEQTDGDHFQPFTKFGRTVKENCRATHHRCNSAKSDKEPIEWSKRSGKTVFQMIHDTNVGDS